MSKRRDFIGRENRVIAVQPSLGNHKMQYFQKLLHQSPTKAQSCTNSFARVGGKRTDACTLEIDLNFNLTEV